MATTDLTGRTDRPDDTSPDATESRGDGDKCASDRARRRPATGTRGHGQLHRSARIQSEIDADLSESLENPESGATRRANFQPGDAEAANRQLVADLRKRLEDESPQSWVRPEAAGERIAALTALALADEALGKPEQAAERLASIPRGQLSDAALHLIRRSVLARRAADSSSETAEDVERVLEDVVKHLGENQNVIAEVDALRHTWSMGRDIDELASRLDDMEGADAGPLAEWWRARLASDVALERGRLAEAHDSLEQVDPVVEKETDEPPLTTGGLESRQLFLAHLLGRTGDLVEEIPRVLTEDVGESSPASDWFEFAVWRVHALGDRTSAASLIEATDDVLPRHREVLARYAQSSQFGVEETPGHGRGEVPPSEIAEDCLDVADSSQQSRIWLWLARRMADGDGAGPNSVDLSIQCLNRLVEDPDSPQQEVALLVELGDVYRDRAGMTGAAAEVYREALSVRPTDRPALSSLEQLLEQQGADAELVELWEHELAYDCAGPSALDVRRRIAETCVAELDDCHRAARHLTALLEAKPADPTGVRLARRVFPKLERWSELVDRLERASEAVDESKRRLHLLEDAAECASRHARHGDVQPERATQLWEAVLELEPDHRRAYRRLEEVYRSQGAERKCADLLCRKARMLERSNGPSDEAADAWSRAGSLLLQSQSAQAEALECFMRSIAVEPSQDDAVRSAVGIYCEQGDWRGLVSLMRARLQVTRRPEDAADHLISVADRAQHHFERPIDALDLCREALSHLRSTDSDAAGKVRRFEQVELRLLEQLERWEDVLDIQAARAERGELGWGRVAFLAECQADDPTSAFDAYMRALQADPSEREWLEGIERTWQRAGVDAGALSERLESIAADIGDGESRDRLFKHIARLIELDSGDVDRSHGFRAHGDLDNAENMTAVRVAMARIGDRTSLQRTRMSEPAPGAAGAIDTLYRGLDDDRVESTHLRQMDGGERRYTLGAMSPRRLIQLPRELRDDGLCENTSRLRAEIARLSCGRGLSFPDGGVEGEPASYARWRLHGLVADTPSERAACMIAEIRCRRLTEPVVRRWCDLIELVDETDVFSARRTEFERRGLHTAFPDAFDAPESRANAGRVGVGDVTEETAKRLVALVEKGGDAVRYRRALAALLGHDGLDEDQRVAVLERLADVCAERLGDLDAAREALEHAWRASEEPRFLDRLVRLDERAGDAEAALEHQRRHFQVVIHGDETDTEAVAASGYHLAACMRRCDRRREAIDQLEDLRASFAGTTVFPDVCRDLAELYVEHGRPEHAADVLEELLGAEPDPPIVTDVRKRLVSLYTERLDRVTRAYALQTERVLDTPGDDVAVERLVDIAAEAEQLGACVDRLVSAAEAAAGEEAFSLLTAAARMADEELMEVSRASEMYERALERAEQAASTIDEERRRDALRARGFCLARLPGRESTALETLRELVRVEPSETTTLRAMVELFERTREHDRMRLAKQGLAALGCTVDLDDVRSKLRPSRALELEALDAHVLPEPLGDGVFEILESTLPVVDDILEAQPTSDPALAELETQRPRTESSVDQAARAVETAVGAGPIEVELADLGDTERGPAAVDRATGRVLIDQSWVRGAERTEVQFVLARLGAPLAAGLEPLRRIGPNRVLDVLEAIWRYQCQEPLRPGVQPPDESLTSAISSPLMTVTRRRVVSAIDPHRDALVDIEPASWLRAVDRFAGRLGLLLTGDLQVAIRMSMLLDDRQGDTLEVVGANDVLSDVIGYAFEDGYRHARYALGLGGRPSQMSM